MVIKVIGTTCLLGVTVSGVGTLLATVVGERDLAILCSRFLGFCFVGWIILLVFSLGQNPWKYDLSGLGKDRVDPTNDE